MLTSIVFNAWLWYLLGFAPLALAFLAGAVVWSGLFGQKGWNPRCCRCGHDLRRSLEASTCPECGANLARRGAVRAGRPTLRLGRLIVGLGLVGVVVALTVPSLLPPSKVRQSLADHVAFADLVAYATGQSPDRFTQSVIDRRVAQGLDDETLEALIVSACNDVSASGQPSAVVLRFLDEASKGNQLTDAAHQRLAEAWVQWMRSAMTTGGITMPQGTFGRFIRDKADVYSKALSACPECFAKTIRLTVHPNAAVPTATMFVSASTGMELRLMNIDTSLTIDRVDVRREGETEWRRADVEDQGNVGLGLNASRAIPPGTFRHIGPHELRVAGTIKVDVPRATPAAFERVVPIDVLDPATIEVTALRGPEARAAVEDFLRDIRFKFRTSEFGVQISVSPPRARRTGDEKALVIAGVTLVQGKHEWPVAELEMGGGSLSMKGGMLSKLDQGDATFDLNAPFSLRFTPLPREKHAPRGEAYSYVDERFERSFTSTADEAPGFSWVDQ
ncbi:MAG: zinc ribbon domain-containing protein [Phycisphaerae bacterium]|nr:zinc ribbon domain-containing protein [Phycisphaerae bacterium]